MKNCLRIGGSLALTTLLVWRLDWPAVGDVLAEVQWIYWAGAMACFALAQLISSLRWQQLAHPLGFSQSLGTFFGYYLVGSFFNLVLPTSVGGDVVRAWYVGRGTGRGTAAASTVLADRLIGLYVLIALACVTACFAPLPVWVRWWVALAGIGAIVGLVLMAIARRSGSRFGKHGRALAEALNCYKSSPGLLGSAAFLSLLVQLFNVLLVWLVALAVGLDVPFGYCCVVMTLIALLTLLPLSVNGMGVREGGVIVLLEPLGVPAEQALTLSVLWFTVFLAVGLAGGVWYLLGRLPRCEVRDDAEPVCDHPDQGRTRQPASAA